SGVTSDSGGTLGVSDTANGTIRVISAAGVVSTLDGSTTARGNADATGSAATFSKPAGISRDATGNLHVADSTNHTIRKITPAGVVETIAGTAGSAGTFDGPGKSFARLN